MNESIGAKGVGRDFRRTLIIKKKEKDKLKEYGEAQILRKIEKDVRKKQIYTLIKTLPIAIAYETIKDVLPKKEEKKEDEKKSFIEEEKEEKPKKEQIDYIEVVIVLEDGTKKIIKVPKNKLEEKEIQEETKEEVKEENKEKQQEEKIVEEEKNKKDKEETIEIKPKGIGEEEQKQEEEQQITQKETTQVQEKITSETKRIDEFKDLTASQQEKLDKLKSRKIIDVYEKQLKDIRYELRQLIFEYNVLVDESKELIESKEAEEILDKLNVIIKKIEELKTKINIENLDKYDDNYIYILVEGYLEEFKDQKVISEIKDSKLYILISDKLSELDKEKDKLKNNVEDKKENLEIKEEALDKLKEKYYRIDKVNKELKDFEHQQEIILREIRQKIDNATTVKERTEVKIEGMSRETRRLLRRLTIAMMVPGIRPVTSMAATTALYLQLMRNIINPRTVTRKYKEIIVQDYSKSIESNLKEISKASRMLDKTEKEIDKMISLIKLEFSEYIGAVKECDELLSNLDKIKSELHEKEYEINKIKENQEKELERNNAKVLTIGEYPM